MYDGIAIALAWPETKCKQAGAWYDVPMKWFGINKDNYYTVGHAATILIDKGTGQCHYFDFGRYHSPSQHGRVRSALTDHDLEISTKAIISEEGKLLNYREILTELFLNESNHGTGKMVSTYCEIQFNEAFKMATSLQELSPIPYGPFLPSGTNCSRFVNKVILSGRPNWILRLLLIAPRTLTPTPLGNVRALNNYKLTLQADESLSQNPSLSILVLKS